MCFRYSHSFDLCLQQVLNARKMDSVLVVCVKNTELFLNVR